MPGLVYNDYAGRPHRIKQKVSVLDAASFCEYYLKFYDANSRVFAFEPNSTVTAILDYHESNELDGEIDPRWGQHSVVLSLKHSPQWATWAANNNKQPAFTQEQFAEFLEQNRYDIIKPSPGTIMEIANDLQATTEVEFGSGVRMQDGQRKFKYTETTKAKLGGAEIVVPEIFTIEIPVYVGGAPVQIEAYLRFRVNAGHLVIWYTILRPEEAVRQAFLQQRNAIASTLGVTIINGQVG